MGHRKGCVEETLGQDKIPTAVEGNDCLISDLHSWYSDNTKFTYNGGEIFKFTGDDNVWVFINNRLVVDLGGIHGSINGKVDLVTSKAN